MFCEHGVQIHPEQPCDKCKFDNFVRIGFYGLVFWVIVIMLYYAYRSE